MFGKATVSDPAEFRFPRIDPRVRVAEIRRDRNHASRSDCFDRAERPSVERTDR